MKRFNAFGLSISADIPFGRECGRKTSPDLVISNGAVAPDRPPQMTKVTPCIARSEHHAWYRIPGLLRAQLELPGRIHWFEEKALPKAVVSELLMDVLIPIALRSRGCFVRNGFTLCNEHRALLVTGCREVLSAEAWMSLCARGMRLLSDGLCAVRRREHGGWEVQPGIPQIKYLDVKKAALPRKARRLRDRVAVYMTDETESFSVGHKPLAGMLFITADPEGEEGLISVKRRDRLQFIHAGRPVLTAENDRGARAENFEEWVQLSSGTPFFSLNIAEENHSQPLVTAITEILG